MVIPMVDERRLGRFVIPTHIIQNESNVALAVLEGCLVVKAEACYTQDGIEYVAYHNDFAPAPKHSVVPHYDAVLTRIGSMRDGAQHVSRVWKT